jgi:hypothetical protein
MHTLTREQALAMRAKRKGNNRPKPRSQVIRMQASLLLSATDPNVQPHIRAQCARAWDVLEERLRIIDGKPLPGQLRPDLVQATASRSKRLGPPARLKVMPSSKPATVPQQSMLVAPDPKATTGG